jgi:hypothetical protein
VTPEASIFNNYYALKKYESVAEMKIVKFRGERRDDMRVARAYETKVAGSKIK